MELGWGTNLNDLKVLTLFDPMELGWGTNLNDLKVLTLFHPIESENLESGEMGGQDLGEPTGGCGGTARPEKLKAFLIRLSKNPFRQAWLGK